MNMFKHIKEILGVLAILVTFGVWAVNYHEKFVTKIDGEAYKVRVNREKSLKELDANIRSTTILVTMFELHGVSKLNEKQTANYNRENSRLISLQSQRDRATGHEIN